MGAFEGLRVEPFGAIVAYLPAGVVRLEPDESDAGRAPGWYDWSWREVADPLATSVKDDDTKVSKASVGYGAPPVRAQREGERCGVCTMFLPPAACSRVAGEIEPEKWCEDFEMKLDDAKLDEALRRADAIGKPRADGDASDMMSKSDKFDRLAARFRERGLYGDAARAQNAARLYGAAAKAYRSSEAEGKAAERAADRAVDQSPALRYG